MLIEYAEEQRYISEMRIYFAHSISIRKRIGDIRRLREENLREIKQLVDAKPEYFEAPILLGVSIERHKYYDDRIQVLRDEMHHVENHIHEMFSKIYSAHPAEYLYKRYVENHQQIVNEAKQI